MRSARVGIIVALAIGASAVAAASASAALPEYKECAKVAKHTGEFTTKDCNEESSTHEGNFELLAGLGKKVTFTATAKPIRFELEGGGIMECGTAKTTGELTGTKEERDVVMRFTNCKFFVDCSTPGEPEGTIVTEPLRGVLGYISKSPLKVGIVYSPEGTSPYWVQGLCSGSPSFGIRWEGALLGRVTGDLNMVSKESEQNFAQIGGHQEFTHFEGGSEGEDQLLVEFNSGSGFGGGGGWGLVMQAPIKGEALMIAA
jgi:hypothetical protein